MLLDRGCVVCGHAVAPVCQPCRSGLQPPAPVTVPGIAHCRVAFQLDDRSRPILAAYKYRRHRRIARWFGSEMASFVPRCADAITWLPATPERRRSRGFDQSEELAKVLGQLTGVPVLELLRRDRNDVRQTGRSRRERLAGPTLHAIRSAPAFVVVVDDVITTGSSMRAAVRALTTAAGPQEQSRIVAVAVASTPTSEMFVSTT